MLGVTSVSLNRPLQRPRCVLSIMPPGRFAAGDPMARRDRRREPAFDDDRRGGLRAEPRGPSRMRERRIFGAASLASGILGL